MYDFLDFEFLLFSLCRVLSCFPFSRSVVSLPENCVSLREQMTGSSFLLQWFRLGVWFVRQDHLHLRFHWEIFAKFCNFVFVSAWMDYCLICSFWPVCINGWFTVWDVMNFLLLLPCLGYSPHDIYPF